MSFSFNLPHQPLTAVWCYYFAYKFYLRLEISARQNNRQQAEKRYMQAVPNKNENTEMSQSIKKTTMKQVLFILILLFSTFTEIAFAQTDSSLKGLSVEEAFRPKMPKRMDTLYYPFYDGTQMIEVDHISYWDRKIYFLSIGSGHRS
jgi:hypothetical protein